MSEHTPGPWIAVGTWVEVENDNIPDICICGPNDIGQGNLARTDKEIMANARLIAAAPELLEALQSFERTMWWSRHSFEVLEKDSTMRQMFRAAIAKATGVTNAN